MDVLGAIMGDAMADRMVGRIFSVSGPGAPSSFPPPRAHEPSGPPARAPPARAPPARRPPTAPPLAPRRAQL